MSNNHFRQPPPQQQQVQINLPLHTIGARSINIASCCVVNFNNFNAQEQTGYAEVIYTDALRERFEGTEADKFLIQWLQIMSTIPHAFVRLQNRWINFGNLAVFDARAYDPETGAGALCLLYHNYLLSLDGQDARELYLFWLRITGQARVLPV